MDDPILSNYVTMGPSITYRRSTSIKDALVHSHFTDKSLLPSSRVRIFPCGGCGACDSLDTRSTAVLPGGYRWTQRHHITCTTLGIIYLLQCTCNAFYVGKTRRAFNIRMLEHITAAQAGYFRTAIGRHIELNHNYESKASYSYHCPQSPHMREGGLGPRTTSECKWIFRLKSDQHPGLNNAISFASFLWSVHQVH